MDRSEIDSLKADLRRMQSRVEELETAGEEPVNRRNMLRGLGVAAAGAAVGGLAFARPAAADDGTGLIIGSEAAGNGAQSPTSLFVRTSWDSADPTFRGIFNVTNDSSFSNINASLSCIAAYADSESLGGHTIGVWGASTGGIGAKLDGPVPLKLTDNSDAGAPVQDSGSIGMFRLDGGDLWYCVDDDSNHNWRKVSGLAVAGAYHALTPFRAYDSRAAAPSQGTLATGANRTVSVKDERNGSGVVITNNVVPAGATAVTANVTVTQTAVGGGVGNGGFLAINPGGITTAGASTLNWFGANQSLANGVNLKLNTSRQITVICGGAAGASTHFLIDITGYYI